MTQSCSKALLKRKYISTHLFITNIGMKYISNGEICSMLFLPCETTEKYKKNMACEKNEKTWDINE